MYIATLEQLRAFCERASKETVLAVDTEFLRERTYRPVLCLIQVATKSEAAAIDPLLIDDLEPLRELLADTSKTKVFHACDQDLEVIWDCFGLVPRPLFDTQLAAAFLGHRMQMGYGALVQEYDGVRLAKADGLTDWSKRPLDAEQLRYAEDDVLYLPSIYERMMDELVRKDRLGWYTPELEDMCARIERRRDPREAYKHLKRSSFLSRRQLAIARELCALREQLASQRNLPRKWVLQDEVLVELCRHAPRSVERVRRIRGTDNLSEKNARAVVQAVLRGLDCPPEDCPTIRRRPTASSEADGVIDLMFSLVRVCSKTTGVAVPLIATREDLHAFMVGEDSPLREGWRHKLVGEHLRGLLDGEIGLTVKDGHIELL